MEQRSLKSAAVQGPETNFPLSFSALLTHTFPTYALLVYAHLNFMSVRPYWLSVAPSELGEGQPGTESHIFILQAMIRRVDREKSQFERKDRGAKLAKVRSSENELRGGFKNSS